MGKPETWQSCVLSWQHLTMQAVCSTEVSAVKLWAFGEATSSLHHICYVCRSKVYQPQTMNVQAISVVIFRATSFIKMVLKVHASFCMYSSFFDIFCACDHGNIKLNIGGKTPELSTFLKKANSAFINVLKILLYIINMGVAILYLGGGNILLVTWKQITAPPSCVWKNKPPLDHIKYSPPSSDFIYPCSIVFHKNNLSNFCQ